MKATGMMIAAVGLALATGCVSQGQYDHALSRVEQLRAKAVRDSLSAERRDTTRRARISELERALKRAEAKQSELEDRLALTGDTSRQYRRELDAATAMNASLRGELGRLGKDVDGLLAERGALSSDLTDAKKRLDALRRAQAATEARAALFRSLALKLRKMIDAGELRIALREGRMMLVLSTDVLFDSGKAAVKPNGRRAIEQVASVLAGLRQRRFQVAGHTDNEPIRISGHASNWELSTARALEVVEILIERGMPASGLSAAGYGEFDLIANNDSAEGRAKNRRIEITLVPNIDELVEVP
jgi:chemotaxis protein MotB